MIRNQQVRDPWVAQRFSACLWPRARSWRPGIESHVGVPVHGACFSLCLCLCLSLSVTITNLKRKKKGLGEMHLPVGSLRSGNNEEKPQRGLMGVFCLKGCTEACLTCFQPERQRDLMSLMSLPLPEEPQLRIAEGWL